jgi:hypothetical protein
MSTESKNIIVDVKTAMELEWSGADQNQIYDLIPSGCPGNTSITFMLAPVDSLFPLPPIRALQYVKPICARPDSTSNVCRHCIFNLTREELRY